jgi:Ca2+-binding RTX toxin-like protein
MAASDYINTVQKVYVSYYGRPADVTGLSYWSLQLDKAKGNLAEILKAFGNANEAVTLFGTGSIESKINKIYVQIFGRDAELEGLKYYSLRVTDGTFSLVDIAQRVADGAQGDDKKTLDNKIKAAEQFTAALDTPAEMLGYFGDTAATQAREFLKNVKSTTPTAGEVNAAVASATAPVPASGQTFTLTTGADNFTGGAGNDTFNAIATTFSTGDVLTGGDGIDTLSIADNVAGMGIAAPSGTLSGIE